MKGNEDAFNEMFREALAHGVLKIMVLKHASEGMYPYAMFKNMKDKMPFVYSNISKTDIYNVIGSLENSGMIKSTNIKKGARIQKYCKLTKKGQIVLKRIKETRTKVFGEISKYMKDEFNG